ncbi:MAG: fasciclin domain-containing protein [Candidatus Limnocylindrales bacterium]
MNVRRTISLALVGAALVTAAAVPVASAAGPKTIASVLNDGSGFDTNWYDYDILDTAVNAVLAADAQSPLWAVTDPDTAFTVFAPNDRAFQVLVASLTGKWYGTEAGVTNALIAALGGGKTALATIQNVVLYHIVPAGRVDFATAKTLSGQAVPTALGPTIKFRYYSWINTLVLGDKDPNAINPWVVNSKRDIDAGKSIIHGISLVLRPMDLPPLAR